jgi:hypothetical protein
MESVKVSRPQPCSGRWQPSRVRAATSAGRIIAAGKIDDLLLTLQATKSGHYQWVSSPFFLDLALRKPTVA